MLLPSSFLSVEGDIFYDFNKKENREQLINNIDLLNGYIEFNKDSQVVLFKGKSKKLRYYWYSTW